MLFEELKVDIADSSDVEFLHGVVSTNNPLHKSVQSILGACEKVPNGLLLRYVMSIALVAALIGSV